MPCQYNPYPHGRPCTESWYNGDPYGMCRQKARGQCVLRNSDAKNLRRREISDFKEALWFPYHTLRRWPYRVHYDHAIHGVAVNYCEMDGGEWASLDSEVRICTIMYKGSSYTAMIKITRDKETIERYKWETRVLNTIYSAVEGKPESNHFVRYFFSSEVEGYDYTIALQYVRKVTLYDQIKNNVVGNALNVVGWNLFLQGLLSLSILHSKCNVVLGRADARKMLVSEGSGGSQTETVYQLIDGETDRSIVIKLDTRRKVKLYDFDDALHSDMMMSGNDDQSVRCTQYGTCKDKWDPARDAYAYIRSLYDIDAIHNMFHFADEHMSTPLPLSSKCMVNGMQPGEIINQMKTNSLIPNEMLSASTNPAITLQLKTAHRKAHGNIKTCNDTSEPLFGLRSRVDRH